MAAIAITLSTATRSLAVNAARIAASAALLGLECFAVYKIGKAIDTAIEKRAAEAAEKARKGVEEFLAEEAAAAKATAEATRTADPALLATPTTASAAAPTSPPA